MTSSRVALFHPSFAVSGGAEILIATQASALAAKGLDLRLVTMAFDADRWASRLAGVDVRIYPKRHWMDALMPWDRIGKIRRRALMAAPHLRDRDVVLAYNFPTNDMLGFLDLPVRTIWQCNEPPRGLHMREANPILSARVDAAEGRYQEDATEAFAPRLRRFDQSLSGRSGLRARRQFDLDTTARLGTLFAISAFTRDNARRIYGRCEEAPIYPVVRFPEGGRARRGLDRSGLQVLVHSRLEVLKNIDTVLRGFARFQATCPGACIHIVGEGAHRPRLEALAKELLSPAAYRFHGYLPDGELRTVYESCDVFALLTLDEPFGMVYPEAAAKGLLLIGPDHGGPLEILDGGRLGTVVDPFSVEGLAEAFREIWSLDDAEVECRRDQTDQACRARYGIEAVGPQLLALISKS
jgi:glycosyltransferase involved in cell wall biosynthesis